jgi:hypothetical protein
LRAYDSALRPPLLSPSPVQQLASLSQSSSVSPAELTDERRWEGAGVEPKYTTALSSINRSILSATSCKEAILYAGGARLAGRLAEHGMRSE